MPLYEVRITYSEMVHSEGFTTVEAPDEQTARELAWEYREDVDLKQTGADGGEFDEDFLVEPFTPDLTTNPSCMRINHMSGADTG